MEGLLEHVDRSLMADIQKGLASQPLEASALINHGPHVWPSSKKNDRETDKAKSFMDWAAELGAQTFRVTTEVLDPEARISESEVRRIFCEMIEKLLPHTKARGLSIGLEEHPGFAGTVAKMQKDTGTHFGSQFWHCFRYEEYLERGPESFVNLEAKGRFEPGSICPRGQFQTDRLGMGPVGGIGCRRSGHSPPRVRAQGQWLRRLAECRVWAKDLEQACESIRWLRSIWISG